MTDKPLSQRMRELAPVLTELNQRYDYQSGYAGWGPEELLREAVHVEAEEREAAERDVLAVDLAVAVSCELLPIGPDLRAQWLIRCNGHERVFTYEGFVETGKVWVSRSLEEVGAS